jgi:DNA-binding response OmpR family regulator
MLMERAGRVVTRSERIQSVWPDDGRRPLGAPDAQIAALRRKLDHPVNVPSNISTTRGIGYRFETA